ncbi:hypothetical protein ACFLV1_00850, partial [Chloroflexota bacterium]
KELAKKMNADFFILQCVLEEEIIKERLEQRAQLGSVSDGRWEILEPQKARFDPVTEVRDKKHIILDMSLPLGEAVEQVLQKTG